MFERGVESRTFMPRYGSVNERRNQLHEVIRLSGMNLIIDNDDHQLIIKVASLPGARVQVYFIDNDDYFNRKAELKDDKGEYFSDNDQRAIFFARGVLETAKQLHWQSQIVHCHGWFSAVVPIYLRNTFAQDPAFRNIKIVVSLYKDAFTGSLKDDFLNKIAGEGISVKGLDLLKTPTYENLMKVAIDYADGVVIEEPIENPELEAYVAASGNKVLEWDGNKSSSEYMDIYQQFYDELLG
jgi:starch synthase